MFTREKMPHVLAAAFTVSSLLAASSASAATRYWDGGSADILTDGNGASAGGAGTWDTTLLNWDAGASPHVAWNNSNNDTAEFAGTAGTVTLGTGITAGGLTFNTAGYTVTGSTLTLAGASAPILNVSTGTSTISSDLAGTNGLEKTGGGTLILSGTNNTYSGTTTISAGILQGEKSTLGGASPFGTSTIQLNAGTTLNSRTISANDSVQTFTFGNDVSVGGNATIDFRRNGSVGSAKTHAYGNLSIGSNTLSLTAAGINHTLSFSGATLTGNAIINNGTNATTNIGAITETGGPRNLTKQGGATLRLTGTNTYTGTTTISGGTLEVQGSIASSSSITNNATLTFNSASAQSYGNVISGTGSLTKNGTGTLTLSGNNTFTGSVTVGASGTLVLSGINSYTGTTNIGGGSSSGPGTLSVNSVSDYGVASAIGAASSGAINFNANASNTSTFIYTGTGGSMNRQFSIGTSGDGTVRNGAINNNGSGALILTASTFNVTITGTSVTRTLTLGGTYSGSANEIQGVIQNNATGGAINLVKTGASIWKLSGANTYTGTTSVGANGGTLQFGKANSLYNGNTASWTAANIRVANGGTLAFNVGGTGEFSSSDVGTLFTNLANSTNATTNGMAAGSNFGFDTTNASGGSFEISQVVANSGGTAGGARGLTKLGTGTLVLSNANTYTGDTNITEGTLLLSGSLTASSNDVTVGSTATLAGTGSIAGTLTANGSVAPGNSIGTLSVSNDVTWNAGGDEWVFELGAAAGSLASAASGGSTQDLLDITGANSDFIKGTGSGFTFDFAGTGAAGWYKLVDWAGTTGFVSTDFVATNLGAGLTGDFTVDSGTSALYLNVVVPEPTTLGLLAMGAVGLVRRRRVA